MAGLSRLIARLEALASPEWRTNLSRQLAEQSLDLIDATFKGRKNPYGDKWTPTKQPNPILEKTGALRNSYSIVTVTPEGFSIRSSSPYSGYHQYGTHHAARSNVKTKNDTREHGLPARPMVPTSAAGMPANWDRTFERIVIRFIRETMGK